MDNITAVKEKINIVDLISGYVPLKKAGKNYKANCPFHSEKSPSFMVSEELQRYKCFGCGKAGDIFTFIMETEGVDFGEALKILADKAGIQLKYEDSDRLSKEKSQKEKIIRINDLSAKFYSYILWHHPFGKVAVKYLEDRGISKETAQKFQIGYAPNSWESLTKFLRQKDYTLDEIVMAGLAKMRESKASTLQNDAQKSAYDIFRGRLMFPLVDQLDRIVGFSGRAMLPDQEPKYINSPETLVFHKDRFLFGLNHSKTPIRQDNFAIIVEGEFDMITPFQLGVQNIVASKGTALTVGQINLLKRYTDTVLIVFDSDTAGIEAAVRGIQVIQGLDINIKVVTLPSEYKDPDEIAKKDIDLFKKLIDEALPLWDYYFLYAKNKFDFDDIYQKKKASEFLMSRIIQISDEVVKSEYLKKYETLFDVSAEVAVSIAEKTPKQQLDSSFASKVEVAVEKSLNLAGMDKFPVAEVYFLSLLLKAEGDKIKIYTEMVKPEYFSSDETRAIYVSIGHYIDNNKNLDVKKLYDKLQRDHIEAYNLFESVYLLDIEEELLNADELEAEILNASNRIKRSYNSKRLKELSKEVRIAEAASDFVLVQKLQDQVKQISDQMAAISS